MHDSTAFDSVKVQIYILKNSCILIEFKQYDNVDFHPFVLLLVTILVLSTLTCEAKIKGNNLIVAQKRSYSISPGICIMRNICLLINIFPFDSA